MRPDEHAFPPGWRRPRSSQEVRDDAERAAVERAARVAKLAEQRAARGEPPPPPLVSVAGCPRCERGETPHLNEDRRLNLGHWFPDPASRGHKPSPTDPPHWRRAQPRSGAARKRARAARAAELAAASRGGRR